MYHYNIFAVVLSLFVFISLVQDVMADPASINNYILKKNYGEMQVAQATVDEKDIEEQELSTKAAIVMENLMLEPPDKQIPASLLEKASCIGIFPSVTKAGLIVTGQHGRGLLSCRHDKTKKWGAPAFFTVSGASFGVQAGYKTADVVLLVMDPKGVDALLSGAMTIGSGNVSASSGSLGNGTDIASMRASIITYARPDKGLFAGADLQGTSIAYDGKKNEKVYGAIVGSYETLYKTETIPTTVKDFHDMLAKFAPRPRR
ncbi:MAG TPA: lipid-binding SYLF domain-containing protein [Thermodesulfobacteriota bacterium]